MAKHKKQKTHDDIVAHFQKRCMERLGFLLNQRDLKQMMAEQNESKMSFVRRQSRSRTLWKLYRRPGIIPYDLIVVYDKLRNAFVTVMYYNEFMQNEHPELKFVCNHPEYLKANGFSDPDLDGWCDEKGGRR